MPPPLHTGVTNNISRSVWARVGGLEWLFKLIIMVISHTWAIHATTCRNVRYEKGQLTACHTACPDQESFQGQSRVPSELWGLFEKESYWLDRVMWAVYPHCLHPNSFILCLYRCAGRGRRGLGSCMSTILCASTEKWLMHSCVCHLSVDTDKGGLTQALKQPTLFDWPEGTSHFEKPNSAVLE